MASVASANRHSSGSSASFSSSTQNSNFADSHYNSRVSGAATTAAAGEGLTSFGFLNDTQDQQETSFALGSLFSRVKSALAGTASYEASSAAVHPVSTAPGQALAHPSGRISAPQHVAEIQAGPSASHYTEAAAGPSSIRAPIPTRDRKVSLARPSRGLSNIEEHPERSTTLNVSPPSRTGTADFVAQQRNSTSPNRSRATNEHSEPIATPVGGPNTRTSGANPAAALLANRNALRASTSATSVSTSRSHAGSNGPAGRSSAVTGLRGLPLMLRTAAPAPAVTFTSPATAIHARTPLAEAAGSYTDDRESVVADDGDAEFDTSRDTFSLLRGGAGGGAIDRSHLAKHGWSVIPGFPLSKDILADDTRSLRSSSTRVLRINDLGGAEDTPSRSAAQVGLQTSADAIVRRLRGEGLSRKFWMADENAKECRECLSVFTPFRRKHHCRICGQIFCGRCAAHIIKGKRFDFEGMIRVCNFCKRMLEEYERHELESSHHQKLGLLTQRASKNPNRVQPDKDMISAPLEAQIKSPQAQFAANHLFASANTGPSAFQMGLPHIASFASALTQAGSDDELDGPDISLHEAGRATTVTNANASSNSKNTKKKADAGSAAPFRKGMDDDDDLAAGPDPEVEEAAARFAASASDINPSARQTPVHGSPLHSTASIRMGRSKVSATGTTVTAPSAGRDGGGSPKVAFPITAVASDDPATNPAAIQSTSDYPRLRLVSETSRFPVQRSRLRSLRTVAALDPAQASALIRQRFEGATSRTETPVPPLGGADDEGSTGGKQLGTDRSETPEFYRELRICPEGITPALLEASITHHALEHLRKMMGQTLDRSGITHVQKWLDVLLPFVLTTVSRVKPDAREDQSRDIREFVKIKRIPGGKPDDSEYVDGYVCTKHVATKKMAALMPLTNARIMVIRFPLDYHRGPNQFMSLEPLIAQEREFIRILVARIIALRPQIVVVERTVSRTALELLEKEGIVVVWSVKPDAIRAISRCTQADVINSIDRLALDPRIGRCRFFNVETFQHASFPGWKKSFMRFEGTPKQLGCTIVLRGADGPKLSQVKRILRLMIFVAYNLRLEEHVMADEGAAMETIYSDYSDHRLNGDGRSSRDGCMPGRLTEGLPASSGPWSLPLTLSRRKTPALDEVEKQLLQISDGDGRGNDGKSHILRARARILRVLAIYESALITSSACISIPAPYPILRLKEQSDRLMQLIDQRETEELQRILKDEGKLLQPAASITELPASSGTATTGSTSMPLGSSPTSTSEEITPIAERANVLDEPQPSPSSPISPDDTTPKYELPKPRTYDTIPEESEEVASQSSAGSAASSPQRTKAGVTVKLNTAIAPEQSPARLQSSKTTVPIEQADAQLSGANTTTPTPRPSSPEDGGQVSTANISTSAVAGPASDAASIKVSSAPASEAPTRMASPGPPSSISTASQQTANTASTITVSQAQTLTSTLTRAAVAPPAPAFDLFSLLKTPSEVAKEAEYAIVLDHHRAAMQEWDRYLDIKPEAVSPFNHTRLQIIVTRHCTLVAKPCDGPNLEAIEFYGDRDETLGGHLERLAANSAKNCPAKGCGKNNVLHYNTYVHNQIRIQVVLERFVCPLPNEENRLLSWSYCKVCENATPVAFVTAETWSFSFAKYLELYFYRHDHCKTKLCEHDFYRDQVRYFAYQNMAVRFHSEEVDLYEVSMPRPRLFIDPSIQCNIKNEETATFARKSQAYWDSVMTRIRALGNEACSDAAGINRDKNRGVVSDMIRRCEADRREIDALIGELYEYSPATDVLCLNQARRVLQEKVVRWDVEFIEFEKNCIPSEKDLRRITTTHLKRLFSEKDTSVDARSETASNILTPAAEIDEALANVSEGTGNRVPKDDGGGGEESSTSAGGGTARRGIAVKAAEALGLLGADLATLPLLPDLLSNPADSVPQSLAEPVELRTGSNSAGQTETTGAESGQTGAKGAGVAVPSRTRTVPSAINKLGRTEPKPFRDGNFDDETDAADLSPVETRPMFSRRSMSNPVTAPSSPTFSFSKTRSIFESPSFPRADESSCTESELVGSVSGMLRRYDSPKRQAATLPPTALNDPTVSAGPGSRQQAGPGSLRRPSLRRGKTEEVVSVQGKSSSTRRKGGLLDHDDSESAPVSPMSLTGTMSRNSRLPRAKRNDSGGSVATLGRRSGTATPTSREPPPPPPSSYRPPKGEGLKAGPRPILGRTGGLSASAYSAVGPRGGGQSSAVDGGSNPGGSTITRQVSGGAGGVATSSSTSGIYGSRVPVARRSEHGPGTRSRVSTIAKHFDRISKEAERERERQHRLLLAQRARRARPVAMTRARVEVFSSVREAVRDDESEADSAAESSGDDSASAADNEDEDDDSDSDDEELAQPGPQKSKAGGQALRPSVTGRRLDGMPKAKGTAHQQLTGGLKTTKSKAANGNADDDGDGGGGDTIKARKGTKPAGDATATSSADHTLKAKQRGDAASVSGIVATIDDASTIASQDTGRAGRPSPPAASELESDAQSVAASSVTTSNMPLTLPSYLRSGFASDSDSMPSLERSFLKTLSGFWAFRTGEILPLEYPMLNSEHVFADSDVIFREDEPTSIIAFTLSSTQYKDRLKGMQSEMPRVREKEEPFMPGAAVESKGGAPASSVASNQPGHDSAGVNGDSESLSEGWGLVDVSSNALEGVLKKEGRHFRCEFESGSTRLWCKILFAEQFDALRRTCDCDVSVIESLSRCFKWDSSGGKSGLAFLKSRDHRFVVKQLSRFEMDAFSKFAPQYFNYMSQCLSRGRKTTLAKIFGCFRIGFRNPQTGKSLKLDCFVMENLFYGLENIRSYDLKGSTRNRYVQETGRENEVLLDENLIESSHLSPIFIREHSKKLLRASLYNDSLFLADMNVMDYSLMVGIDKRNKQLVVGIIDFVRTYTWDKRVESFVKETALLGGAGKGEPTIITPPDYRTRFLTFIDRGLLLMPDHWIEEWAL
ncbi:hypothetical protein BCV70DRAFT_198857 [Testicularia cyperi]|uniref:1-phosphatidylinositol-3-phosphate 5-kinase n=1 Tax=Testicularia cyperi TaxID=1882483 RepID=A0A317XSX0_9BASI|nr:hypothetical protein BCV70DRAFT_198857 [Testicularia cyperi]